MNVTLITAKLNGEIGRDDFDIMKATLAKDVQEIQAAQRAMTAEAEMFLHLTVDTSRALWVAAPRSEKQTVQSVLFPEGICCRKDIGFFAPVTNELEVVVFKSLLELADHGEAYEVGCWAWVDLDHRPRAYQSSPARSVTRAGDFPLLG